MQANRPEMLSIKLNMTDDNSAAQLKSSVDGNLASLESPSLPPQIQESVREIRAAVSVNIDKAVVSIGIAKSAPLFGRLKDGAVSGVKAANQVRQKNALRTIGAYTSNFLEMHGQFPPAQRQLEDGKALLSWRVHLLPALEMRDLYLQFQLHEPWDSKHNLKLLEKMPDVYKRNDVTQPGYTTIMRFSGSGTPFVEAFGPRRREITDGVTKTLHVVVAGPEKAVPWTKPVDLPLIPTDPVKALGTLPEGIIHSVMMDGSVREIPATISPDHLRNLIQHNDGQTVPPF